MALPALLGSLGGFVSNNAGAIIGAGAGLAGGMLSNSASAASTKKQMDFQYYMSKTAYQRAAKDLERAGLNRVLALGGPATTPPGAQTTFKDLGANMVQGMQAGAQASLTASQAKSAKAGAAIDSMMMEEFKKLPQMVKHIALIGNLATKVGVDPLLLLGSDALGKAAEITPWGQLLKELDKMWAEIERMGERKSPLPGRKD